MYHKIQGRVFDVLEARTGDKAGRFFMAFIVTLIVLNVTAVMLETVPRSIRALLNPLYEF